MKGKQLRLIRKQMEWTQARLAEAVGVATNTVARWERDERPIREPIARLVKSIRANGAHKK